MKSLLELPPLFLLLTTLILVGDRDESDPSLSQTMHEGNVRESGGRIPGQVAE
jgi:hypothetical protein